jgi:molecular chaperone DnaK (HSP70)
MTLLGLDLNSSRARAVCGTAGLPRPMALDGTERELPLAVSLEQPRRPVVGRAGVQLCKRLPHLACLDFLPHLGTPREWKVGRRRFDSAEVLNLVLNQLQSPCAGVQALALALPSYLTRSQAGLLAKQMQKAKLPLLGSVTAPLALAWSAHEQDPWRGLAVVLDADSHAMTMTVISADEPGAKRQARVVVDQALPHLGVRAWKDRLLDAIADRCIRQSRRDPRESAEAEQRLYEQLDDACDACQGGKRFELAVQAAHWYQNVPLQPQEFETFGLPLVKRTLEALTALLTTAEAERPPVVILLSAAAGRLPGLATALCDQASAGTTVALLSPDAAAKAAHEFLSRWQSGALPSGHVDVTVPLSRRAPEAQIQAAPPRSTMRSGDTKLPARESKMVPGRDDFSVPIDD